MATIPIYGQFESRTMSGALVDDSGVVGGWHVVDTIADRDAIKAGVRKSGMIAYVIENETPYVLTNNLTDWKELITSNTVTYTIPVGNLSVGTIDVPSDDFESANAVYVVDSTEESSVIIYSGIVYPTNLPEYTKDSKVYMTPSGELVTTITTSGMYKYIGYISNANDTICLILSEVQINYRITN